MAEPKSTASEYEISRDRLAKLLNEDPIGHGRQYVGR
jgi:hypothetical protein